MKKVLSVVLAVAMVLACVASLAFVLDDQTGIPTATNSALDVEGIYVTNEAAMVTGIKFYSELANNNDSLYAKQQIIRLAVDLAVKNPNNDQSVEHAQGNVATLIFDSDTVDFSLNQQMPYTSMVLYKPCYMDDVSSTNLVRVVANEADYQPYVSEDKSTMEVDVYYYTHYVHVSSGVEDLFDLERVSNAANGARFVNEDDARADARKGLLLLGVSDDPWTVKTDYTLVVTGVTKGETTQEGRVTLSMEDKAGDTFNDETPGVVKVERNGHTYIIEKWYDNSSNTVYSDTTTANNTLRDSYTILDPDEGKTDLNWTARMSEHAAYNEALYDVDAVGYQVFVLLNDMGDDDPLNDIYGRIGMFETEQVRKGAIFGDEQGEDIQLGLSLGLSYYDGPIDGLKGVYTNLVQFTGTKYTLATTGAEVYRTTNPDYLYAYRYTADYSGRTAYTGDGVASTGDNNDRYVAGLTARQALEQFMSDFGFSTGAGYNYKVQDSNFVEAATYDELGTATYNGNAIVITPPEEDDDVEEGTGEDEIPDEGDIDEELPDEGDIDEEPIPDEPVPETGDASAAVAVALTAAALVAAAGLAVVLKKAR